MTVEPGAARTVVIVVGSSSTAGLAGLVPSIRARGLRPAVLHSTAPSPGVRALADEADLHAGIADPYHPPAVAAAAVALAGGVPAAVVSWHDGTIVAAAHAAARLGLGRTDWRGLARARNKYAARRALRAAGLPVPRFATIGAPGQAAEVAAEVGLPAIVKPLSGTASSLVRRVDTVAALAQAHRDLAQRLPLLLGDMYTHPVADPDAGQAMDQTRTFLVEGLLRGTEVCADAIVRGGAVEHLLMLENALPDEQFFGRGFTLPPVSLPAGRQAAMWRAVDGAVAALGIDNTLVHIEVIDDAELGPTVVEVNAGRGGGVLIGPMVEACLGADLREEYLSLVLDLPAPPRADARMPTPLANLVFFPPEQGRLVALEGLDQVEEYPDVVMVRPPETGGVASADHESSPLNVLVYGLESAAELRSVHDELAAMLRWRVAPLVPADG
jgi:biotin carboxylase